MNINATLNLDEALSGRQQLKGRPQVLKTHNLKMSRLSRASSPLKPKIETGYGCLVRATQNLPESARGKEGKR